MDKPLREYINDCDLMVIGIGNEWNWISKGIREDERYKELYDYACDGDNKWLLPVIEFEYGYYNNDTRIDDAYKALSKLTGDRRNFLISDMFLQDALLNGFDAGYAVFPCGNYMYLQPAEGEDKLIKATDSKEFLSLVNKIHSIVCDKNGKIGQGEIFSKPFFDGKEMYLNQKRSEYSNIKYNESAYLDNWNKYMKYLSGTVGSRLLILELGVSLDYPTVIRWPFEKMVYVNNKARLIRVHHNLHHHTPEISDRTDSIQMNSVDFIMEVSEGL